MNNKNADIFLLLILFFGWVILCSLLIMQHNQTIKYIQEIDGLKIENKNLKNRNDELVMILDDKDNRLSRFHISNLVKEDK